MSPFAWIFVGLLLICPYNGASKPETLCTCQQSGLGPFGHSSTSSHHSSTSSHHSSTSSHQSGHGTFEHSVSSSENSAPSGPFGLGHYVTHAISSAAETADSLLNPFGHVKGALGSFGHSGSSSHHHVSITYGHSGQSKSVVTHGTRQFGPLESSSGTSKISGSIGSGHYGTYGTSSTEQAAEAAEARPFPNGPDGGGPGPLGLGPFGNSGSSSHQHVSITFGPSGQSKTLGQGQYNLLEAVQTKPSQFESEGGGSVSSGYVPFGQSEPSSDHHATVSVGLTGAISNQPEYGLVGLSGSSSFQNGTRLFSPSEETSGTSTPNGSFGSGHYVTYTTSATSQTADAAGTRPSPYTPDGERPAPLEPGSFEHLGSSSHQHVSVTFGQLGQNKSSESGLGQYIQYNNSVEATAAEAAEKNPSTMGSELVPSGSGQFSISEPSSNQHVTVSVGISGTTSDQPERGPIGSSESNSIQQGTRLFEPSEASSVTSTSSDSFGSGPSLKYSTSSTEQTAEESQTRPFPNGSDVGGSGQLESGLFENSRPSSNQQVSETFGQLGQSQSLGQELEQYVSYNKSVATAVAEAEKTKPSQFEKDGREPLSSGSVSFGQSEPNSDHRVTVSIGLSGASSGQLGGEIVGPSGSSSDQHEAKLFEPSEASSGASTQSVSIGSGHYVTNTTSSTAQTPEAAETRPSADGFGSGPLESGLFGHSESHQNVSVTFVPPGPSESLGTGLEQYIQYNNSAAGATVTKTSQVGLDGGGSVPSGSGIFGQLEPSSYQGITVSSGLSSSIPDQPGQGQVGQSGYTTVQNGTGLFGSSESSSGTTTSSETFGSGHNLKFPTSSVGQMAEEPDTRPLPTGPDTGGPSPFAPGPFGQSGSSSNEHVSINFGQQGQSKSFEEGLGQYNQYSNSVSEETKPSQFGPDGGVAVSSGSVSFGQQVPSSYQQISGSAGQYATSSNQPERGPDGLSESSSGQNGIRHFGTLEANSGTSTSSGSFESEHYLKYPTSSVGQTAEELVTGSSPMGTDTGGSGLSGQEPFGQSGSSSNQYTPITFGQPVQSQSFGEDPGHYNQYSNSVSEETKPSQFGPDGGVAISSGSVSFGQQVPNSYQQISGSAGQYATSSDQPGRGPHALSESSSGQNGIKHLGTSESNSGTSTSSGSFGSENYLKYPTSAVGQMAEEPETRPSPIGPDTGGSGLFGLGSFEQSGSSSNQQTPITFGQSGQSQSFGEGPGHYNQYSNSVSEETKTSQFGPDGVVAVSSGSASFGQQVPSSYQQISGSSGQYTTSSDQPGRGPHGLSESSSGQNGIRHFGTSEANSGSSASSGSFGSEDYLKYPTSAVGQMAEEPEAGPSSIGQDTGGSGLSGLGSFEQSVSSSNQQTPITFGQSGQSQSFGEGPGHYNQYSNSVSEETKPSQFGPDGGVAVSSGSASFGQQVPSSYQQISGSAGQYTTSSDQPGRGPHGLLEASSGQNGIRHFGTSEANSGSSTSSGSFGSEDYLKYPISAVGQMAEESATRPSSIGQDTGGSGLSGLGSFEQSVSSSNQQTPITFGQSGQSQSFGEGPGHYNQYSNSVSEETKPSQFGPDGGVAVSSGSASFGQQVPSSYQQISGSSGQYTTSSDQPGRGPHGLLEASSGQNGIRHFGTSEANSGSSTSSGSFGSEDYLKYPTSAVGQMAEESATRPSSIEQDTGGSGLSGIGPFEQSESSSNQQTPITFGQSGQSQSFGEGPGHYNQYSNSVSEETKPSQFGPDGGVAVSSGSVSLGQQIPSSYQQISGSAGQYGTISDQPERGPNGLLESTSGPNGIRHFGTSEANLGTSTSSGSFGSEHYVKYPSSSLGQMAEPETGPSSIGPDTGGSGLFGLGPFGQSGSSSNQQTPINFGQSGQSQSFGENPGHYNQYSNLVSEETKPSQFGPDGGVAVSSGSVSVGQQVPSSYQQISGTAGQYATSSDQPGRGPDGLSESSSVPNGIRLFGTPEANSGASTSSGSFGSEQYLKYPTSSVGQMAEEPEAGPSPIGPYTVGSDQFGLGTFGQSGSSSNQHTQITFEQPGQSHSYGEGLGHYNQYSNSVAEETKPSQFGPDGKLAISSGSVSFEQPGPSSYQQISGSTGQYATSSGQPGLGPVGLSGSSSGQNGNRLFEPSEFNSGTHSSGSFGHGHNLKFETSSVGQMAEEPETGTSPIGQYTGAPSPSGHGSFGQSGSSSNQHTSITFGQPGQSKSFGEGLGQYNQYSNSVAADTKPSQFGSYGGLAISSGSESFEKPGTSSYQQISDSFGPYNTISDQPGLGSAGSLELSSDQPGDGLFRPSGASSGISTQSGSFGSGHFPTHSTPSIAQTAETPEARPYPSGLDGEGQGPEPFGHSGYSSNQQVSVTVGHSGQSKSSGQGLGQYTPYSSVAAEAAETKPAEFGPDGGGSVPSGSVPFGQPGPSSYQRVPGSFGPSVDSSYQQIPGSFGQSDDNLYQRIPGSFRPPYNSSNQPGSGSVGLSGPSSDQYESEVLGTSVGSSDQPGRNPVGPSGPNSVQLEAGLFRPSDASSGTSISSGSFGSGHYVAHATLPVAHTAEAPETGPSSNGPDGGGPFKHSGYSSQQHTSVTFGQSGHNKSPEQGLGQYIPYSNSVAEAEETMPSQSEPDGLYRPLGPNAEHFKPSQLDGPGPFMQYSTTSPGPGPHMQYTTTSPALTAEEETKPQTFVKNGEELGPTRFTPFWPSGHSSYKPVSVTFSPYGTSADHPEAGTFGLPSTISDQPAPRPYETWEQSTGLSGTSRPLEQGSYVPYTKSPEEAMGTVGQLRPGLLGSSVISVPSGMFGQGPGIYIPYRNAGAAMKAIAQKEPSTYEPHKGEADPSAPSSEQPALGYIGPSTPSSYEPSTGQSTVASESSGQLGSGHYNSHTPLETTTMVAVSPVDKKAIMKSASRLSSLLTTARVSTAISYLLSSGGFNPSSLSKVISYLIKSILEAQPGISGNEMLIQALLEVIASLVHILSSASVGEVGNCPSSSSSLVGQSITHALGG